MVICIKNLRLSGILGVFEEERHTERSVIINARIEYDAQDALRSDLLEDALDYKHVCDRIVSFVTGAKFKLIEALAHGIAHELITDVRILTLRIEVEKPNALLLAESVSAIVYWKRRS